MKIEKIDVGLETRGGMEKFVFEATEKGMLRLIEIAAKDMYRDPLRSLMTEFVQNGIDAHVAAKVTDKVVVTLPTPLCNYYSVRDFGTGMSVEEMRDIFRKVGESTKDGSNEFAGAFGLGKLVFAAYGGIMHLTSFKDGRRMCWICRLQNGEGEITLVSDNEDKESRPGVLIEIPIKDSDVKRMKELAATLYIHLEDKIELISDVQIIKQVPHMEIPGVMSVFTTKTSSYHTEIKAFVVMGGFILPITSESSSALIPEAVYDLFKSFGSNVQLYIHVGIGEVDIVSSRDAVRFTDKTKNTLTDKLVHLTDMIYNKVKADIAEEEEKDGVFGLLTALKSNRAKIAYLKSQGRCEGLSALADRTESQILLPTQPKGDLLYRLGVSHCQGSNVHLPTYQYTNRTDRVLMSYVLGPNVTVRLCTMSQRISRRFKRLYGEYAALKFTGVESDTTFVESEFIFNKNTGDSKKSFAFYVDEERTALDRVVEHFILNKKYNETAVVFRFTGDVEKEKKELCERAGLKNLASLTKSLGLDKPVEEKERKTPAAKVRRDAAVFVGLSHENIHMTTGATEAHTCWEHQEYDDDNVWYIPTKGDVPAYKDFSVVNLTRLSAVIKHIPGLCKPIVRIKPSEKVEQDKLLLPGVIKYIHSWLKKSPSAYEDAWFVHVNGNMFQVAFRLDRTSKKYASKLDSSPCSISVLFALSHETGFSKSGTKAYEVIKELNRKRDGYLNDAWRFDTVGLLSNLTSTTLNELPLDVQQMQKDIHAVARKDRTNTMPSLLKEIVDETEMDVCRTSISISVPISSSSDTDHDNVRFVLEGITHAVKMRKKRASSLLKIAN